MTTAARLSEIDVAPNVATVCRVTGATYRQIDHWLRCGYIPGVRETQSRYGRRTDRTWTLLGIRAARALSDCADAGIAVTAIAEAFGGVLPVLDDPDALTVTFTGTPGVAEADAAVVVTIRLASARALLSDLAAAGALAARPVPSRHGEEARSA